VQELHRPASPRGERTLVIVESGVIPARLGVAEDE
jgi:hypothetical protein